MRLSSKPRLSEFSSFAALRMPFPIGSWTTLKEKQHIEETGGLAYLDVLDADRSSESRDGILPEDTEARQRRPISRQHPHARMHSLHSIEFGI